MARAQIDNAQSPHPDAAAAFHMEAFVIRSAMADLVAHGANGRKLGELFPQQKPGYSAHVSTLSIPFADM